MLNLLQWLESHVTSHTDRNIQHILRWCMNSVIPDPHLSRNQPPSLSRATRLGIRNGTSSRQTHRQLAPDWKLRFVRKIGDLPKTSLRSLTGCVPFHRRRNSQSRDALKEVPEWRGAVTSKQNSGSLSRMVLEGFILGLLDDLMTVRYPGISHRFPARIREESCWRKKRAHLLDLTFNKLDKVFEEVAGIWYLSFLLSAFHVMGKWENHDSLWLLGFLELE